MSNKDKIREFIIKVCRKPDVRDDEDFYQEGLVNSLFAMQLILFLEKEFQIHIENADLDMSHFQTIDQIASLVEKKKT